MCRKTEKCDVEVQLEREIPFEEWEQAEESTLLEQGEAEERARMALDVIMCGSRMDWSNEEMARLLDETSTRILTRNDVAENVKI